MVFFRLLVLITLFAAGFAAPAFAPAQDGERPTQSGGRVSILDHDVEKEGGVGLVLFLFGAFCALWAQNSGRSAWLWFFLGLFFSVVTVLFLLTKNSNDNFEKRKFGRAAQD